ncbi:hypothetical protein MTR67_012503 [Solanum verrucosum]|uniref:O-fucosyltransferase family protein n=1 Tax=Solanum verrucosum TaxID=315347 RepID=A0AAF0TKD6_SOLVR|nr:hypothetical protein MTR67_012503 [Solanum verrucosum]
MHAYNRVPSSGQSSPSAPSSPRLRSKPAPRFPAPQTLPQHLASQFLSLLLRRQGIFLFAPLIYISAVLFYINTLDFHNLPPPHYAPPGSVYRSPQLYANLRPQMDSDNSNADARLELKHIGVYRQLACPLDNVVWLSNFLATSLRASTFSHCGLAFASSSPTFAFSSTTQALVISTIWRNSYKGGEWRPCIDKSSRGLPESNGYIYIEANGGLNQQRTSICNAVAVAGYLNATLVIPHFHFHSIWRDPRLIFSSIVLYFQGLSDFIIS